MVRKGYGPSKVKEGSMSKEERIAIEQQLMTSPGDLAMTDLDPPVYLPC